MAPKKDQALIVLRLKPFHRHKLEMKQLAKESIDKLSLATVADTQRAQIFDFSLQMRASMWFFSPLSVFMLFLFLFYSSNIGSNFLAFFLVSHFNFCYLNFFSRLPCME